MSYPLLIAEIGNNHEGNIAAALHMMKQAKQSGADLIKFQAGTADGFARNPKKKSDVMKYKQYELGRDGYDKLIRQGRKLNIPVFFSVWSDEFNDYRYLKYRKIPGRQLSNVAIEMYGNNRTFVSIPYSFKKLVELNINDCIPLHTILEYPTYDPKLHRLLELDEMYPNNGIGYSDHTIGISSCITACKDYGAVVIEKHFTMPEMRRISTFRDHTHAATPEEFEIMANILKGGAKCQSKKRKCRSSRK